MNPKDAKYSKFLLVQEMMDTVGVVKQFNPAQTKEVAQKIKSIGRLFLTGEGSSRIFPAKNAIRQMASWISESSALTRQPAITL